VKENCGSDYYCRPSVGGAIWVVWSEYCVVRNSGICIFVRLVRCVSDMSAMSMRLSCRVSERLVV